MKLRQDPDARIAELEKKCDQLKETLRKSNEEFSRFFHAASNPMMLTALENGQMIDVNAAFLKLTGHSRQDLIGKITAEAGLWTNPQSWIRSNQEVKESGKVENFKVGLLSKTGETHTALLSCNPMFINDQPCLLGVLVDIAEGKSNARVPGDSQDQFQALVEHSLQGLAIIREDQIKFCNNAYAMMTGYTIDELLDFPDSKMLIHPEEQDMVRQRHRDRLEGKAVPANYQQRIIRKDGEMRWLEIYAAIVEYQGKPSLQVACVDITDQKLAEEALRESKDYLNHIINSIGDPIFVLDRQHKFTLVNDAGCNFAGKSRGEMIGHPRRGSQSKERDQDLWEQEEKIFKTGKEMVSEDSLVDRQGNIRTILMKKSVIRDRHGNQQIVGVSRDLTDYKRLQAQFLQAQKMDSIGVLAGGIAHDFNNLLNVINGYSELILDQLAQDDPISKDVRQIREAGQHAAALTSQLLAFSRKQILKPEILDLNKTVSQMGSMLSRMIGEDIEIVTSMMPGLGFVHADPGQIQQIVMNLVVNARDAMPQGGKLTIETSNVDCGEDYVGTHPTVQAGSYIMLAISDNGIGMDETTLSHIFEPFFTTKDKSKGTGLGLSTIYGIVKQSHGFIWVYSEPGKGTTFKIYFPRITDEAKKARTKRKFEFESHGTETVLIVEDEASVRALACRVLGDRGYNILSAPNGNLALSTANQYKGEIHLLFTDVVMPGMSGRELVTAIKLERPDIKVLYASGYTDNAIVHQGMLDPGVSFLQKPFTVRDLAHKVREVLDA